MHIGIKMLIVQKIHRNFSSIFHGMLEKIISVLGSDPCLNS